MRRRPLPTAAETAEILARKRSKPPRRPPPPAGKALAPMIKALEDKYGRGVRGLSIKWAEIIADPRLARFTEPVKVVRLRGDGGSVLELKVDGPAAALVQHQAEAILDRVNLALGSRQITRLRIVQGPVKARPAPHPQTKRPRGSTPLDALSEADLAAALAGVEDPQLKQALLKLGRGVLRRQGRSAGGRSDGSA